MKTKIFLLIYFAFITFTTNAQTKEIATNINAKDAVELTPEPRDMRLAPQHLQCCAYSLGIFNPLHKQSKPLLRPFTKNPRAEGYASRLDRFAIGCLLTRDF